MKNRLFLNRESFNTLLSWLDSDRNRAAAKYEAIRRRLITIFTCRMCAEAEELADETFDRVTRKVGEIKGSYVGDPALYFYGVAHNVHLEYLRKRARRLPPPAPPPVAEDEPEYKYECLEACLRKLSPADRKLILDYYGKDKQAKIDNRKQMAERLGIALNALRLKAYRIRASLHKCVLECVAARSAS